MPEVPSTQTQEEIQQQNEARETLQTNVLDKIKSNDIFKSLDKDLPHVRETDSNKEEDTQKHEEDNIQEESNQEDQEQTENQEEEEVIPKSKIQPRIDQLTARLKAQQAEIEALKSQTSSPKDEIQRQLDGMSENELEDSLIQVRVAKEKARDDESKLSELVRLERRIEKQIVQAPQKFTQNQVSEANKTIERLVSDGEVTNENYPKVLEIAKEIYQKYPKMQKQLDGQSMAIELAVEHYKQLGRTTSLSSTVKSETQNLKGQLNNLKKKTTLDTKNIKSGGDKVNLEKLRNNAMTGTMKDKERYAQGDPRFKIDAMIPDFLKG